MIHLDHLTKRYRDVVAVDDLTLEIARGELLVVLGESGCGKTTTLKMINRLIEPTSGFVRIDGQDALGMPAHELRRRIGYVFQKVGLFPHMTVGENVGVTLTLVGRQRPQIRRRVDELLELVELDPATLRDRWPAELSGGQQQRVGVARALAAEPRVMLLDEPFGALDALTRARLQESFARIRRTLGLTAMFVTHDVAEALLLGDRVAVMDRGRVRQIGPPGELLRAPADGFVRGLLDTPRRQAALVDRLLGHRAVSAADPMWPSN
jgi:osmoprotectant transport system ATP-binding protein